MPDKEPDQSRDLQICVVLYNLAVAMAAARTLDEGLQLIVEKSRELLSADASYVALSAARGKGLFLRASSGLDAEAFKGVRLSFAGRFEQLEDGTPRGCIVPDCSAGKIAEHFVDPIAEVEGFVSGLVVPIRMRLKFLGVLCLFNRRKTSFGQSDLDALALISGLAAVEITRKLAEDKLEKQTVAVTKAFRDLKKAYRDIKNKQESIIRLERYAIAGKVTSALAHETRNPISSIGGFASILKRRLDGNPDVAPHIDAILEETRKLEQLVDTILKAGHEVKTEFQEMDPAQLAEALYQATREKARLANIKLTKRLGRIRSNVLCDRESIIIALKELILNAIEASPKKGKVLLKVRQVKDWVIFSVTDQGGGVGKEAQGKIFDPLYSTKELSSGLGLSFAKEIIETHNGYITFDTNVHGGTTFHAYLPASRGHGANPSQHDLPAE
jgi:signal transduction histidine kinase